MVTALLIVVVLLVSVLTASRLGIAFGLVVGLQHHDFLGVGHRFVLGLLGGKSFADVRERLQRHLIGEDHLEYDVEVSILIGLFVEGQTHIWHRLNVVGLDDLAWLVLNANYFPIQMLNCEVDSSQRLQQ